jgi:hypothetical protein
MLDIDAITPEQSYQVPRYLYKISSTLSNVYKEGIDLVDEVLLHELQTDII